MEEHHFPIDISLSNIGVRLNDSESLDCELGVENLTSCSIPFSSDQECNNGLEVTSFNEEFQDRSLLNAKELPDELKDKLHIGCTSSGNANSGILNGCNASFYKDVRCIDCVDFSVNGLSKCNSRERINAHFDDHHWRDRICVNRNKQINQVPWTENSNDAADGEGKVIEVGEQNICLVHSKSLGIGESLKIIEKPVSETESKSAKAKCAADDNLNVSSSEPVSEVNVDADIRYVGYESETQMPDIMRLIQKDLSEPYSIYTYRYFIHNWPKLCFLALDAEKCVGAIVCKLDVHKKHSRRGYIAMLAVDEKYRKKKIGSNLVLKAIQAMVEDNADEVVLETEITNKPALRLYENLGFVRDKRLFRYYLNGVDALRLKLWLR